MLYTEVFCMRYYARFSQIGSHIVSAFIFINNEHHDYRIAGIFEGEIFRGLTSIREYFPPCKYIGA